MVEKKILASLETAAQKNLAQAADARATVALLAQIIHDLQQEVFANYLRSVDAPLTEEIISTVHDVQNRVAAAPDYTLTPEEVHLVSGLRTSLSAWLTDAPPAVAPQRKKVILIVEDEPHIRQAMSAYIARQGCGEVVAAANGMHALALFQEKQPGLVFLDVSLPDMDGFQILATMKKVDKSARVYFVTGVSGEAFGKRANELGAAGYMNKPVDLSELGAIIRSY